MNVNAAPPASNPDLADEADPVVLSMVIPLRVINKSTPPGPISVVDPLGVQTCQDPTVLYMMRQSSRKRTEAYHSAHAWVKCAEVIQNHHEAMLKRWREEVETLLVYAGLFSAVLTAFNVELYIKLQPDPVDTTNALLLQMSAQLNSFTINPSFVNSTQPLFVLTDSSPSSSFRATATAVWVNTLWFSSLICSLSAASIGMVVKQWLHESEGGLCGTTQGFARRRQYRYEALVKWRVDAIVASLPILLLLATALFLWGLLVLLWSLHPIVAGVASGLVGALLLFAIVTTIFPTVDHPCAYKSPQAALFFFVVEAFLRPLGDRLVVLATAFATCLRPSEYNLQSAWGMFKTAISPSEATSGQHAQWDDKEHVAIGEKTRQQELDRHIVEHAHELMMDDDAEFVDRVLRPCIETFENPRLRRLCVRTIRRAPLPRNEELDQPPNVYATITLDTIDGYLSTISKGAFLPLNLLNNLSTDLTEASYLKLAKAEPERFYRVLARLLRASPVLGDFADDIWEMMGALLELGDACSSGLATREVIEEQQALIKRTQASELPNLSEDQLFVAYSQLIMFLAACYVFPAFTPTSDRGDIETTLRNELKSFSDFLSKYRTTCPKLSSYGFDMRARLMTLFPTLLMKTHDKCAGLVGLNLVEQIKCVLNSASPEWMFWFRRVCDAEKKREAEKELHDPTRIARPCQSWADLYTAVLELSLQPARPAASRYLNGA